MSSVINYWSIAALALGISVFLPFIIGLFGGNRFKVKGKVCGIIEIKDGWIDVLTRE
jgi:3-dehydrosphinganine reductase